MHFTEKQYFKQKWIWFMLFGILALSVVPVLNVAATKPLAVLICILPVLLIMALFFLMNLKTVINQKGIHIQFFPFIREPKVFLWEDIQKIELKKYQPMVEYGGYGIRGLGDDKAYNIQGDIGLKLYFKNGKKLMIGTQNPKGINKIVREICQMQKIPFHNSLTE